MQRVTAFLSDDGTLHVTEESALRADTAYWKKRAHEAEAVKYETKELVQEHRQPYAEKEERGGHQ